MVMEVISWQLVAMAVTLGAAAGLLFAVVVRLGARVAALWRPALPFADEITASAGERERGIYRMLGGQLTTLLGAFVVTLIVIPLVLLLLVRHVPPDVPAWALIVALILVAVLLVVASWQMFRIVQQRQRARFEWAAKKAVGNILKRLNFSGNRVFHDVSVEGNAIDHVVIGPKGVFAINVVARAVRGDGRHVAELRNGKLSLDGNQEALAVGDAARNMTLLTGVLSKIVGHRVPVRSVLAIPGWQSTPNGEGNHLLLNENNLAMLTSWNTPDAYLMDEDVMTIQKYLQQASRSKRVS